MILLYHNVVTDGASIGHTVSNLSLSTTSFKRHLSWLSSFFTIVPLADYIEMRGRLDESEERIIALTFDDGTSSTYDSVLPILDGMRIPATFFVTTCHIGHGKLIWGSYLNALCLEGCYPKIRVGGRDFLLNTRSKRIQTRRELAQLALKSDDPVIFTKHLRETYPLPDKVICLYEGMTEEQVYQAAADHLIEIGSHAVTHRNLGSLTKKAQKREIFESREVLTDLYGSEIRFLAYPSGSYNRDTLELVEMAGYQAAFATIPRQIGHFPRFEMGRVGVYSASVIKLLFKTFGIVDALRKTGLKVG
jgi:peptidoglycan/xylan/chitin deacetylase (PgdA/CDA1 family)